MDRRLKLHEKLVETLGNDHVYFQPPENIRLNYPCIIYERYSGDSKFANNKTYQFTQAYEVTFIDQNPDNLERYSKDLFEKFEMVRYNRHFKADNLNHDVFIIYF